MPLRHGHAYTNANIWINRKCAIIMAPFSLF